MMLNSLVLSSLGPSTVDHTPAPQREDHIHHLYQCTSIYDFYQARHGGLSDWAIAF